MKSHFYSTISKAIFSIAILVTTEARSDTKKECAEAYEKTQVLRDQGKLIEARKKATSCGSTSACSIYVVRDCMQWLAEIEANMPSIVLRAKDPTGADAVGVQVLLDGQLFADKLDGKALAIDPGEHIVRFELAGFEAFEQKVLIKQGEKDRPLIISLKRLPPTTPPLSTAPPPPPIAPSLVPLTPPVSHSDKAVKGPPNGGIPAWAWISGGVGLGLMTVGAGFGIKALAVHNELITKCGGDLAKCPVVTRDVTLPLVDQRSLFRSVFIGLEAAALVGLGAAVVGIATAPPKAQQNQHGLFVAPFVSPFGGGVAAQGQF